MHSPGLMNMRAIVAPDYEAISIDPGRQYGAPETLHVTAHTANSAIATVTGAQEGTAARIHRKGEYWVAGPLSQDMGVPVSVNGTLIAQRSGINLVPGANVTLSGADNDAADTTDVVVASTGGGGGSVWRNGDGAPSNGLGSDGDYYLDDLNGYVYYKASGAYTHVATIEGPPGAAGPAGAPGAVWRNGSGAPSDSLGIDGDFYLDDATGNVYERSSGTYSIVANISGPAGSHPKTFQCRGILEMVALPAEQGDLAERTDSDETYVLQSVAPETFIHNNGAGITTDSARKIVWSCDYGGNRIVGYDYSNPIDGMPLLYVLGQPDFTTVSSGTTATKMSHPEGVAYDSVHDRLFVADSANNRVLIFEFSGGITTGMAASVVLGQSLFTTSAAATTQIGMNGPTGVDYDAIDNRLFVVDSGNRRCTVFDATAPSNHDPATHVVGQTLFTTNNTSIFSTPNSVAYKTNTKKIFVTDTTNDLVLEFEADPGSIVNGEAPLHTLGSGGPFPTAANNFYTPEGISYDPVGDRLFVADTSHERVLIFHVATVTDNMNAVHVLGQTDFVTTGGSDSIDKLNIPTGVHFDSTTNLVFVAIQGIQIYVFNISGGNHPLVDGMNADYFYGVGGWQKVLRGQTVTVDTTTNQQINGQKTFLGPVIANAGLDVFAGQLIAHNGFEDKQGQMYNVMAWGATGDGVDDDTVAIQAAITACANANPAGGIIYFPPGNYLVSSLTINVANNGISFLGAGIGATTIRASTAGIDMLVVDQPGVTLSGITFDGFGWTSGTLIHALTSAFGGNKLRVRDCHFANYCNAVVIDGVDHVWVEDSVFDGSIGASSCASILFANSPSFVYIDKVTILTNGGSAGEVGIDIPSGTSNSIFISDSYVVAQLHGLSIDGGGTSLLLASDSAFAGITGSGVIIHSGNTLSFSGVTAAGIADKGWNFAADTGTIDNVELTGCSGSKSGTTGLYIDTPNPITNVRVRGGNYSDNATNGIFVGAGQSKFSIIGARVGSEGFTPQPNGIVVAAGSSDDYIVAMNDFRGNTTPITDGGTGTNKQLVGNIS